VDQTVASKYKSISASNDGLVFADFCLHMILYQTPPQGIRCSAGLSVAQSDRVTGNLPLKGDTLASRKVINKCMCFTLGIPYSCYACVYNHVSISLHTFFYFSLECSTVVPAASYS
jgi:hypothetical protein